MEELNDFERKDYDYIINTVKEQIDKLETDDRKDKNIVVELEPPKDKPVISRNLITALCLFEYKGYFCVPEVSNCNVLNFIKKEK